MINYLIPVCLLSTASSLVMNEISLTIIKWNLEQILLATILGVMSGVIFQ